MSFQMMINRIPAKSVRRRTAAPSGVPAVRAIRGATQVSANDALLIEAATGELLTEIMARNSLADSDFISIFFTVTTDLTAVHPAKAARALGLAEVPLVCATEIPVPEALPRVVRVMAHVYTVHPRAAVRHVYLGEAATLRPDLVSDGAPHCRSITYQQGV
jgi:chorismate mutase